MVEPFTAGIIPHQVDSPYSNMVIYDLAGQHQYFSSHCACLEAISLNSPATFLLLQDIRKDEETITKEVHYWFTMMDSVCHKSPEKSSVIVVGTHADMLTQLEVAKKLTHLRSVAKAAINQQKLVKVVSLNLTKVNNDEMKQFMSLLHETNKKVIHRCPSISKMCHMILAFLKAKFACVSAITLSDLIDHLKADKDNHIDPDICNIVSLLWTLSEKGLITYTPSKPPLNSWIVLDKESILKKVNGALFADDSCIASNTGIVPSAVLEKIFPEYNIDMITQFMIYFELCQVVDLTQVDTNMAPEGSSSPDLGPLLFFPALVRVERPSTATVPRNSFCWSMKVKSLHKFLTPRFFHVLLRRLSAVQATPHQTHIRHRCDVWSRGTKWLNEEGVATIVEMDEMFQSISMAIFSADKTDPKYSGLARTVLAVIKEAYDEFCPNVEVLVIVSCPPEASSDHSDDTKVDLSLLKKALREGNRHIVDINDQKQVVIDEWIMREPCLRYLIEGETIARFHAVNLSFVLQILLLWMPPLLPSHCQSM